jgi:hypothetical protein
MRFSTPKELRPALASQAAGPILRARRAPRLLLALRRAHLYSGLCLVPWVLLFGLTGILFNHPSWWNGQRSTSLGAGDFEGTALELLGPGLAAELGEQVRLAAPELRLDPHRASFEGDWIVVRMQQDGRRLFAVFDPTAESGWLHVREEPPPVEPAREDLALQTDLEATVRKGALELARNETGREARIERVSIPKLKLETVEGAPRRLRYDFAERTLVLAADEKPAALRERLTGMHTRHLYPATLGSGWVWALSADALGIAMLTWAGTGLVMWWQMKRLRTAGIVALVASAGVGLMLFGTLA